MGDVDEVVGDDAHDNPAFHSGSSFVATAVQPVTALQHADAAFAASAPLLRIAKPPLLLQGSALCALGAEVGDRDTLDASLMRVGLGRAFASALPVARLAQAMGSAVGDAPRPAGRLSREEGEIVRQAREDVRRHGVVRAEGRPIPSVNAFSAPVFDHEGEPVLVITALGHQDDFLTDWDSPGAKAVRNAAAEISSRLGWRGGTERRTA